MAIWRMAAYTLEFDKTKSKGNPLEGLVIYLQAYP